MEAKKVLTRKGLELSYVETYYLDYEVNEDTGMIDKSKKVKYYTKNQMSRNLKALKDSLETKN